MHLSSNRAILVALTKDLLLKWQQTKESWQDAKSLEFERNFLEDLSSQVDKAVEVIERLDKILTKVRNDCE